jgi:hypothetical protein
MEDEIVLPETALLAKQLGFKEKSFYWYQPRFDKTYRTYKFGDDHLLDSCMEDDCFLAPTQTLLQRYLREKHNKFVSVTPVLDFTNSKCTARYYYPTLNNNTIDLLDRFKTYEEALETGLKYTLNLLLSWKK